MSKLDMMVKKQHVALVETLENHTLDMSVWGGHDSRTCNTIGCLWGSMFLAATGQVAEDGPCDEWVEQSQWHMAMDLLFCCASADPATVLHIAKHFDKNGHCDLSGQDLRKYDFCNLSIVCLDLSGAKICGVDFGNSDFESIDLSNADARGAYLMHIQVLEDPELDGIKIDKRTEINPEWLNGSKYEFYQS